MAVKRRAVIIAVVMVSLIAGTVLMGIPYLGIFFMVLSFASFMYLGATLLKGDGERRYRDPYDLNLLKEIHERANWDEANMPNPEDADVVCPHCGHLYGQKLKICPMCKRMP
ncbi:MAG TPA: hypothetical protein VGL56_12610 [Fimbriimonadaceae bacterium]|jgi:hypothetical protein